MSWTINSKSAKTTFVDTDNILIQESAGTVKKLAMSVLRKIIPATDSTSAFRVTKADGITDVLRVNSTNGQIGVNTSAASAALDVVGPAVIFRNYTSVPTMYLRRYNGTESVPTAVQSGDITSIIGVSGYGASTLIGSPVSIRTVAEENYTDSTAATYLAFRTCATGSTSGTESMRLTGAGEAYFPRIATTASAANAFLDSGTSNSLLRSTSSRKYKTGIKDIEDSTTLDYMRPITYKSNPETVPNDDPTKEHYGFIAEELDEIDEKLVQYVDGVPDGVQYDRIVVLLVKRIHELEARLAKAGI